jgi:hypothetical protein
VIYLGHFSYGSHVERPTTSDWHGYFICVAEAESAANALNIFDALLRRLARSSSIFSDVEEVYLDSCIEIKSIQRKGLLTFYKEIRGKSEAAICASLIGVEPNRNVSAYEFVPDNSGDDQSIVRPFLVFLE